jgi:hypothetical protein
MTDSQHAGNPARASVPPEIAGAGGLPATPVATADNHDIVPADAVLSEEHRDFAAFLQGYVWNAIALADTKATWAFAICAGMVAYLVGKEETRGLLLLTPWVPLSGLAAVTLLLLIAGAAFAFLVIVPRLSASPEGLVYFGAVAKHADGDAYVRAVAGSSLKNLVRARLVHAYDISRISSRKYVLLRRSMWCAVAGLALAAALTILGWRTPEEPKIAPTAEETPPAASAPRLADRPARTPEPSPPEPAPSPNDTGATPAAPARP